MLSVLVSGSTERFFLFDALGSTDRLLATNQGVTDQYLYEAFGKEVFLVCHATTAGVFSRKA